MKVERVADYISKWMAEYCRSAGSAGFVTGISGGVDSAVSSALAARTGLPSVCASLPIHQPASHLERAYEHIALLKDRYPNVRSAEANLTSAFDSFLKALSFPEEEVDGGRKALADANTRSRLRMTALYYYAGLESLLVVGTGNKVEDFGVGFFTKYGDGGVDISPIADLTKSEVYELAAYLGVPSSILSAPPTDGLFGDDRSDEDQIGATYPELEWAMQEYESGADASRFTGRQKEVFAIYSRRHLANLHKMLPIPVCIIPAEYK